MVVRAKRNDGKVGGGASGSGGDEHGSECGHYVGAKQASGGGKERAWLENTSARRSTRCGGLSSVNTAAHRIRVTERRYDGGCTGTGCG